MDTPLKMINKLIIPPTNLELIVVDHCNITCRSCNHASPMLPNWFADPDTVYRDLLILAKHYRPPFVKIIGGEPLMHKHLDAVIHAARASKISDYFKLITNGTLIHEASDAIWEALDEVEISCYPGVRNTQNNIILAKEKALFFGKKLTIFRYDNFRETLSLKSSVDQRLINKLFAACKIARLWGCHAVRQGYFYMCPQSIYIPILTGKSAENDRLLIEDSSAFHQKLANFLNPSSPLESCANCTGSNGRQNPHELLPRRQWSADICKPIEDMVDYALLEKSLVVQNRADDCKIPSGLTSIISRFNSFFINK